MTYMQTTSGEVFETGHPEFHAECKKLTESAGKLARRDYCRAKLLDLIVPNTTVYTVLRHCSASGMQRRISLFVVEGGAVRTIRKIDVLAADLLRVKLTAKEGIPTTGCGMDMGFELVYRLGSALWPDGTPEPHGHRNGLLDNSGGYALRHEWL